MNNVRTTALEKKGLKPKARIIDSSVCASVRTTALEKKGLKQNM